MHKRCVWGGRLKIKIYIDWFEDDGGFQAKGAVEIIKDILKKDFPVDILIEQF
jgi:hypothetical protein